MYEKWCDVDDDHANWALVRLNKIKNTYLKEVAFIRYMNDVW